MKRNRGRKVSRRAILREKAKENVKQIHMHQIK